MIKIKNSKFKLVFAALLFLLLATNIALAHDSGNNNDFWTPGEPLVPCGGKVCTANSQCSSQLVCSTCELLHLVRHVIDFLMIVAAPVLATFFFIVAGVYIMLGGANPGMLSKGKKMFTDALMGVVIVLLAWLIVNTLIKSLAKATVTFEYYGANGQVVRQEDWDSGKWWEFSCSQLLGNGGNPPPPSGCTATVCISNERATNLTSSGATITWTTNILATSQVHYGADLVGNCGGMAAYTPINNNPMTSHSIDLSGFGANATFCYQVISTANGYTATGEIKRFTTR